MAAKKELEITVMELNRERIDFLIRGTSPFICNAMSAKAQQQLILPPKKKNAAEKASSLKHNPMEEFMSSMYKARDPDSPTEITIKATAIKSALRGAALDIPGTAKTQIGRLCFVLGDEIPIYGIPQMMMSVVRSSDINKTPDVRTRAVLTEWCCSATILFAAPIIKEPAVVNLLAAAGMTQGLGDWRQEKGSGNYGAFELVGADDAIAKRLMREAGKDAQIEAMKDPVCYDSETEELYAWFTAETKRRGFKIVSGDKA